MVGMIEINQVQSIVPCHNFEYHVEEIGSKHDEKGRICHHYKHSSEAIRTIPISRNAWGKGAVFSPGFLIGAAVHLKSPIIMNAPVVQNTRRLANIMRRSC